MGGVLGGTQIEALDINASEDVLFAGRSYDSGMVGSGSWTGLAGILPASSTSFTWIRYYNIYNNQVLSVVYHPDGAHIYIHWEYLQYMVLVSITDGTVTKSMRMNG